MKNILKFACPPQKSSASVVEGKLILSFPYAKRPTVWQMDLTEVKASALEVLEEKKEFSLFVKTPKGERVEIAPFETKEDAVEGLMAASNALENAQGQIRPTASATAEEHHTQHAQHLPPRARKRHPERWIMGITGIIVVFILWSILVSMSPPPPGTATGINQATATSQGSAGVPIPADDFLKNR